MDVTKLPPSAVLPARALDSSATEQGANPPQPALAMADRASIRPLDLPGALQIFLAEVRAALDLQLELEPGDLPTVLDAPPLAARAAVELFLRAIPQDSPPVAAWSAAAASAELALQAGLERALSAVNAWQDVAPEVGAAVAEARDQTVSMLVEAVLNPAWARPEWASLLPRFDRFRRRRRAARRLQDPDYAAGNLGNNDEYTF